MMLLQIVVWRGPRGATTVRAAVCRGIRSCRKRTVHSQIAWLWHLPQAWRRGSQLPRAESQHQLAPFTLRLPLNPDLPVGVYSQLNNIIMRDEVTKRIEILFEIRCWENWFVQWGDPGFLKHLGIGFCVRAAGERQLRIKTSATSRLRTQAKIISASRTGPIASEPTVIIQAIPMTVWVDAPWPIAYARTIDALCRKMLRDLMATTAQTINPIIAAPKTIRTQ